MSPFLNESDPLKCYGHNLTVHIQQGAFPPLAGQDAVVSKVFQVLQRRNKSNPVIIDADETRRWAIVAEVIRRMTVGDAPEAFCKWQVIALNYEALFSNLSDDDDTLNRREHGKQMLSALEKKLDQVAPDSAEAWALLDELFRWPLLEEWIAPTRALARLQAMFIAMHQASGTFLLFVDHFHRLIGGEWEKYPIDATELLKPALARGQIQLIGACTPAQYRLYIERDAAMQRRCQEIGLPTATH